MGWGECLLPACDCVGVCKKLGKATPPSGVPSQTLAFWNDTPCPYCGTKMHIESVTRRPTRDHIEPRSRGGSNTAANKAVVCTVCNADKGDRTIAQFYMALVQADDDRAGHVARFIRERAASAEEAGQVLQDTDVRALLREIGTQAQVSAARFGLQVAVCVVTVNDNNVLSFLSPFAADGIESQAVAHQLAEQARLISEQSPLATPEAAE